MRSRDVLEHIERVLHHVRRLEHSAETAVQMHFSAQGNRTNDIMRTLTVLTAIFLPLNLITGFFGMNFEFLPLIHSASGFWWTHGRDGLHRRDAGPALLAQALPGPHRALKDEGTQKKARRCRAFFVTVTREGSHHCRFAAVCVHRASALDSLRVNRGAVHRRGHRRHDIRARRMEIAGG